MTAQRPENVPGAIKGRHRGRGLPELPAVPREPRSCNYTAPQVSGKGRHPGRREMGSGGRGACKGTKWGKSQRGEGDAVKNGGSGTAGRGTRTLALAMRGTSRNGPRRPPADRGGHVQRADRALKLSRPGTSLACPRQVLPDTLTALLGQPVVLPGRSGVVGQLSQQFGQLAHAPHCHALRSCTQVMTGGSLPCGDANGISARDLHNYKSHD